jgi:hypothetical protein
MTKTIEASAGPFRRLWQTLAAWERAMDYSPYDYALDRVGALEHEVLGLKEQVASLRRDRGTASVRAVESIHT